MKLPTKYKPNINLGTSEEIQAASRGKYKANSNLIGIVESGIVVTAYGIKFHLINCQAVWTLISNSTAPDVFHPVVRTCIVVNDVSPCSGGQICTTSYIFLFCRKCWLPKLADSVVTPQSQRHPSPRSSNQYVVHSQQDTKFRCLDSRKVIPHSRNIDFWY